MWLREFASIFLTSSCRKGESSKLCLPYANGATFENDARTLERIRLSRPVALEAICSAESWLANHLVNRKSRFGNSSLHQRDSRSVLFAGYTGDQTQRSRPSPSPSPNAGVGGGYGYSSYGGYSPSNGNGYGGDAGTPSHAYRTATPNKKGQYSDAVLNELESQNDEQVAGILGKVKVLKDVSRRAPSLSIYSPARWRTYRDEGGEEATSI